jgi:hypothetical protein
MAETKTRTAGARGKTPKRKPAKARKPKASTRTSSNASRSRSNSTSSKNGVTRADSARKAVEETAKQAGHSVGDAGRGVGRAARKAKTPLLAGGAAIVGAAGGLALGARHAHHPKALSRRPRVMIGPKMKVDSHDLAKAAKEVGQFGMDVGQLASELRRTREEAGGTRRRSPIEVVLQGLTTRSKSG